MNLENQHYTNDIYEKHNIGQLLSHLDKDISSITQEIPTLPKCKKYTNNGPIDIKKGLVYGTLHTTPMDGGISQIAGLQVIMDDLREKIQRSGIDPKKIVIINEDGGSPLSIIENPTNKGNRPERSMLASLGINKYIFANQREGSKSLEKYKEIADTYYKSRSIMLSVSLKKVVFQGNKKIIQINKVRSLSNEETNTLKKYFMGFTKDNNQFDAGIRQANQLVLSKGLIPINLVGLAHAYNMGKSFITNAVDGYISYIEEENAYNAFWKKELNL